MAEDAGTAVNLYSVEECNAELENLTKAYAFAKLPDFSNQALMDTLRPQIELWQSRVAEATAAGRILASWKRDAAAVVGDSGDGSAAKYLKSATGAHRTAPRSAATATAAAAAVSQRASAGVMADANLAAAVITPCVLADLTGAPAAGAGGRGKVLQETVIKHVSDVVKDIVKTPGGGDLGAQLHLAFETANKVAEQVVEARRHKAAQNPGITLDDLNALLANVQKAQKKPGSKPVSTITIKFMDAIIADCDAKGAADPRKPVAITIKTALTDILRLAREAAKNKKAVEKAAIIAAAVGRPAPAEAAPAAAPVAAAGPAATPATAPSPPAPRPAGKGAAPPPAALLPFAKDTALLFTASASAGKVAAKVRTAACVVLSVDVAASTAHVKVIAVLDAGKLAQVPQAPGGPHAGKKWGDYLKSLEAGDMEVLLTLPLDACKAAAVEDGQQNGAFKTAVRLYNEERRKRVKAAAKGAAKAAAKGSKKLLADSDPE